ncbi:MAG: Jag N-terminal domain-containing protein [Candidatus Omnitrophota bacterium]
MDREGKNSIQRQHKDPQPRGNTPEGTYSIEIEDITVAKAIQKALKTLHAKKQEVNIEVLKEEHKGLFGMGGADLAKIRATLKQP